MTLKHKMASLCASGAFLFTALPGFYQDIKPTDLNQISNEALSGMGMAETLLLSTGGAILAGFLGYQMGLILENPRGRSKKKRKTSARSSSVNRSGVSRQLVAAPLAIAENAESSASEGQAEEVGAESVSPSESG